jgi:hypothetical protein
MPDAPVRETARLVSSARWKERRFVVAGNEIGAIEHVMVIAHVLIDRPREIRGWAQALHSSIRHKKSPEPIADTTRGGRGKPSRWSVYHNAAQEERGVAEGADLPVRPPSIFSPWARAK